MTEPLFSAVRGFGNAHAQTLLGAFARPAPPLRLARESLRMTDGEMVGLAWGPPHPGPIVLILHGLTGSAQSPYALRLLNALHTARLNGVVILARGSDGSGITPQFQHAGQTADLQTIVETLQRRFPYRPLAVVGYSLGGSVVLNWLAERADTAAVAAACAVSVPFELEPCARALERGFSRLYQYNLLRSLKCTMARKFRHRREGPVTPEALKRVRTLYDFDNLITAPLHGFRDAEDYYTQASCRQRLGKIRRPTLIVHAQNDPFVPRKVIPAADELSDVVQLNLTTSGGHVGFVGKEMHWLEHRLLDFLTAELDAAGAVLRREAQARVVGSL